MTYSEFCDKNKNMIPKRFRQPRYHETLVSRQTEFEMPRGCQVRKIRP